MKVLYSEAVSNAQADTNTKYLEEVPTGRDTHKDRS